MAEESTVEPGSFGCQDTGNPVLDSVVNIIRSRSQWKWDEKAIRNLYATISDLATKEPGSLVRRLAGGKYCYTKPSTSGKATTDEG